MFRTWIRVIPFVAVWLLLDQGTKFVVDTWLVPGRELMVFEYFSIILTHNSGIAFGLLAEAEGVFRVLMQFAILGVTLWVIYTLHTLRQDELPLMWPLAFILAGAVSNGTDRIVRGEIVDFLALHYDIWYFPAFNFADVAIFIGVVAFIFTILRRYWPA